MRINKVYSLVFCAAGDDIGDSGVGKVGIRCDGKPISAVPLYHLPPSADSVQLAMFL